MEEGSDKHDFEREEIFSKAVRAGKRTYFFDVKNTKSDDLYLTITESKRRFESEGKFVYDKHKIFLYKEDFEKFLEGYKEVVEYIKANSTESNYEKRSEARRTDENSSEQSKSDNSFSNVNFEDLDK